MRKLKLFLALIWTLLILVGSIVNNSDMPKVASPILGFDKLIHASCYFVLVILWLIYFNSIKSITFKKTSTIAISVFIFGIVIEFLQMFFTLDRSGDVFDVIANTIGIILALMVFKIIKPYFSNSK